MYIFSKYLQKNKKNILIFKLLIIIIFNLDLINQTIFIKSDNEYLNDNFLKKEYNLSNYRNKIKLGIYIYGLKGGGTERLTSIFINYLSQIKLFDIYLLTQKEKEENEFNICKNIKRIFIENGDINIFINKIKKLKIEIFIFGCIIASLFKLKNIIKEPEETKNKAIEKLNNMKNIKIIFYAHSCFLYWVYYNYNAFKSIYNAYRHSKYVISLLPFENDYLLRKLLNDNKINFK